MYLKGIQKPVQTMYVKLNENKLQDMYVGDQ
jgi:hypothetical protein